MNMMPLETVFERKAKENKSSFPRDTDYFLRYQAIVEYLRKNIYPNIDSGLAANSEEPGLYTAHNGEHFDEVVRYAGSLLGVESGSEEVTLTAYELYMLLVAIRIHDAGNIHGREKHERKCFPMLREMGEVAGSDDAEKKIIANIAQAHGGRTASGDKDTIGALPQKYSIASQTVRPQLLAAIVRFADEICENSVRAASYLLKYGNVPKQSQLYHKYAESIVSNVVDAQEGKFTLQFCIKREDVAALWGCAIEGEKTEDYLIDGIFARLAKMDQERRYCNRFTRGLYVVELIRATIEIVDADREVIATIAIPEFKDEEGYPSSKLEELRQKLKDFCGAEYGKKLLAEGEEKK